MGGDRKAWTLERCLCLAALLCGVGFKFWLIHESEIIDFGYDPREYVLQILHPENGGLGYGPGTGRFARIFYDLGIRYRVGIEWTLLAAYALVLKSLLEWPGKTYLTTGLFLFALFDPALMELCWYICSDPIWLAETLIGFSFMVFAVQRSGELRWTCLVPAIIALGYSILTRTVFVPLMGTLLLLTGLALAILFVAQKSPDGPRRLAIFSLAMWTMFLGLGSFYVGTCVYDFKKYGFYGISAVDCREFKDLYLCLQSVGAPNGVPYCPVDQARRKIIAQAGPHSRWLMQWLDHDAEDRGAGLSQYSIDDIPSGQLAWAVFHATMPVYRSDLREIYAYFQSMEDEIAEANRRGVIQVRFILPLPDARLGVVSRVYPHALAQTFTSMFYEPKPSVFLVEPKHHVFLNKDFDRALHRRTIQASPFRDQFWAILTVVYAWLYPVWFFLFVLSLLAALALAWRKKHLFRELPLSALMRQVYLIMCVVIFGWYSVFIASGIAPASRYLIFNHVMLPILTCSTLTMLIRHGKKPLL
jgi:hypothetical protein